jgi:hypothetical protein
MLAEARPDLGRYRAESDADWPNWAALGLEDVLARLRRLRATLVERVEAMTPEQAARTGVHPVLGEMAIPLWLEFFLLHEAHHLYVVLGLVRR